MLRSLIASLAAAAAVSAAGAAHSAVLLYEAAMSGANEVPPNASAASGFTTVKIDGDSMQVDVTFSGLVTPAAAAHIHCCTPPGTNIGVAVAFPGFPAATSGTYSNFFDLLSPATYTSGFLTGFGGGTAAGAEAALLAGLADGLAYSNIHNSIFPGGEIRGLLAAAPVPEPATWALLLLGFGVLGARLRRRRVAALA